MAHGTCQHHQEGNLENTALNPEGLVATHHNQLAHHLQGNTLMAGVQLVQNGSEQHQGTRAALLFIPF